MTRSQKPILFTAFSLLFTFLHAGPLYGTGAALVLTVLLQLYLPGWLLIRIFNKPRVLHPISRFAWILAGGMGLTICLGGAARLLHVPLAIYVLMLHGVMFALALIPSPDAPQRETWKFSRHNILHYGLMGICCVVLLYAGYERNRIRFNSFADQSMFVSQADWLVNNPDSPEIDTRMAGTIRTGGSDVRGYTDGWTYTHAAWVLTSGVPAAQLIWFDLPLLFIWTVPLVTFALAYEITGRETTAVWSAGALTLFSLMTLDSLVYLPTNLAFGQFGLVQMNTLRVMSRALMLPLALMAVMSYLRAPKFRDLILIFVVGLALASMHPQQVLIFLVVTGATGALWWLSQPTRIRLGQGAVLGLTLASLMFLPYLQRAGTFTATRYTDEITDSVETDDPDPKFNIPAYLLSLENLPIIGTTYIIQPTVIFYHPLIVLAVILGLVAGFWWRRSLAAQYIFGSTAILLVLLFMPGVTEFFARATTLPALPGMVFGFPVAITLGASLDAVLRRRQRGNGSQVLDHQVSPAWNNLLTVAFVGIILLLVFEPIPIPASARDQIRASNQMQSLREMHGSDQALVDSLLAHLPHDQQSILITPNPVANFVIESVPGTIITGGRRAFNNKWTFDATLRFFTELPPTLPYIAPWLDDIDVQFIQDYAVTHIVVKAETTRLPQLVFQPERFELLDTPAEYWVFRVIAPIEQDTTDALFQQMNVIYGDQGVLRWNRGAFELDRPANPAPWAALAETWTEKLAQDPDDDRSRYGLAVTYTLMGEDMLALPLWQQLHERYPAIPDLIEAVAYSQHVLGQESQALDTFLTALESPQPATRILAANALLEPTFFYQMDEQQIQQVIAVTQAVPIVWEQSLGLDMARQQATMLMSAGMLDVASQWLDHIPPAETTPDDLTTQALLALAQGDIERALSILRPATDPDQIAAPAALHPDRWTNNTAAQMYHSLLSISGTDSACSPELHERPVSPMVMVGTGSVYITDTAILQTENSLTVCATFAYPELRSAYDVNLWRVQVVSPDATMRYGLIESPATFYDAALTRTSITFDLPGDIPPLTPAQVYIEAMYDPAIILSRTTLDVVLNRPEAVVPDSSAVQADLTFGDAIILRSYAVSQDEDILDVILYWEASTPVTEDYQVFVHVMDEKGQPVLQGDSGPVDGRYPTSQWRLDTLIEDLHSLSLDPPLPTGEYRVLIGLYRLSDGTRLPISSDDASVTNDSLQVYDWVVAQR
jgi:hypothetical protein